MIRKLKTRDLFTLTKIVQKMNLKEELKKLKVVNTTDMNNEEKADAQKNLSVDIIFLLLEHVESAKEEFYKLFSDLTKLSSEEVSAFASDKAKEQNIPFDEALKIISNEANDGYKTPKQIENLELGEMFSIVESVGKQDGLANFLSALLK